MKKLISSTLCAALMISMSASCKETCRRITPAESLVDGYKKIALADSFNKKFGAWSFIIHRNIPNSPRQTHLQEHEKSWQSVSFLYGRYEVTLEVQVILKCEGGEIVQVLEKKNLYIWELKSIRKEPDGTLGSTTYTDFQPIISGEKLEKLAANDWDFDSIGVKLIKDKPVKNIEMYIQHWNVIHPEQANPAVIRPVAKPADAPNKISKPQGSQVEN